jgi:hypothetical protein
VKILVPTIALALVLSVAAASAAARSGLRGKVLIEPGYPVCPVDAPCTRPGAHILLVFSRRGRAVRRTRASDDGAYRIKFGAGTYTVTAPGQGSIRKLDPTRVVVRRGRYLRVIFKLDIGTH